MKRHVQLFCIGGAIGATAMAAYHLAVSDADSALFALALALVYVTVVLAAEYFRR